METICERIQNRLIYETRSDLKIDLTFLVLKSIRRPKQYFIYSYNIFKDNVLYSKVISSFNLFINFKIKDY